MNQFRDLAFIWTGISAGVAALMYAEGIYPLSVLFGIITIYAIYTFWLDKGK